MPGRLRYRPIPQGIADKYHLLHHSQHRTVSKHRQHSAKSGRMSRHLVLLRFEPLPRLLLRRPLPVGLMSCQYQGYSIRMLGLDYKLGTHCRKRRQVGVIRCHKQHRGIDPSFAAALLLRLVHLHLATFGACEVHDVHRHRLHHQLHHQLQPRHHRHHRHPDRHLLLLRLDIAPRRRIQSTQRRRPRPSACIRCIRNQPCQPYLPSRCRQGP
mmetsp:Transcript_12782/g.31030  ORF Transcript_12782/g.31030 Transcript_12782/m.31030 type:complete len:212 (-) Transcript_12782:1160-1795(-)